MSTWLPDQTTTSLWELPLLYSHFFVTCPGLASSFEAVATEYSSPLFADNGW
jgi:hypothetical protein